MSEQIIDGVVSESDIVPATQPQTIFRTDDPIEVIKRTSEVAGALKNFLQTQGLVSTISGREYIVVEGWQMLGMMLGVTPVVKFTRADGDGGWEAGVELHDRTGRVVGSGEAECLASERSWKSREDYARRSMAQTRAIGKAYRNTFGFIAKAAGFEATPAEEMPTQGEPNGKPKPPMRDTREREQRVTAAAPQQSPPAASAKQRRLICAKAGEKNLPPSDLANVLLVATGQKARAFESQEAAQESVNRWLDRLPAESVDGVLEGIERCEAVEA